MNHKNVFIIAGPNGAGKTTFAREFLPEYAHCPYFINADLIAQGLSPFSPQQAALKAGKLVLREIKELAAKDVDFGFESTLSGKSYLKIFHALKRKGYRLFLFFLWIPVSGLAIARIKERVREGGHDIPDEDVKRRYERSYINLFDLYMPIMDSWMFFDNSGITPKPVAQKTNSHIRILDKKLFREYFKNK